jgi:hypothetical protein
VEAVSLFLADGDRQIIVAGDARGGSRAGVAESCIVEIGCSTGSPGSVVLAGGADPPSDAQYRLHPGQVQQSACATPATVSVVGQTVEGSSHPALPPHQQPSLREVPAGQQSHRPRHTHTRK